MNSFCMIELEKHFDCPDEEYARRYTRNVCDRVYSFSGNKISKLAWRHFNVFQNPFPLYSFRVKNMTTDNVVNLLSDTKKLIPEQPYSTEEGVAYTLKWMRDAG